MRTIILRFCYKIKYARKLQFATCKKKKKREEEKENSKILGQKESGTHDVACLAKKIIRYGYIKSSMVIIAFIFIRNVSPPFIIDHMIDHVYLLATLRDFLLLFCIAFVFCSFLLSPVAFARAINHPRFSTRHDASSTRRW